MILKKITQIFLFFLIIALGSIDCSYGKNAPRETDIFIKECTNYYRILRDKVLWIDGFRNKSLPYFANHTYADIFLKKQNSVINSKASTYERKSYDYKK